MVPDDKTSSPEREQTDEGLRSERERTDHALAAKQARLEDEADEAIRNARVTADAVLSKARDLADREGNAEPRAVAATRAKEDDVLEAERAKADRRLERERDASAAALARLLPLEREKTDGYLLTERDRHDEALAHRDDFLAIVSHDLRNLLSGIMMSAEVMSEIVAATPEGKAALDQSKRIRRLAGRMNRLIGDLVDVTSIDAGKLAIVPKRGDAATLLAEAIDTFRAPATTKGLSLTLDVQGSLVAELDHDRVLQVLANLLTNAIKFTPAGGTITVRGERKGDELLLSVRDTGQGIPEALLDSVFERFWQLGRNDRRGLGLGLYISRCIVEAHHGKIWAESEPGKGSALFVSLPA